MVFPGSDIYVVNPMGYGTLGKYDRNLIGHITGLELTYMTNIRADCSGIRHRCEKIYSYSDKWGPIKLWSYLLTQFKLFIGLRKRPEAVVHFQWLKMPIIDFWLIKGLRHRGLRCILTVHNILPHDSGERYRKIFTSIYHEMDVLIVHTIVTKKELVEQFKVSADKIKVIPHGVFAIEGADQSEVGVIKEHLKKKFGLREKRVFGLLGRISKYKGIQLVVDTWLQMLKDEECEDLFLIIAGNGQTDVLHKLRNSKNVLLWDRPVTDSEFMAALQLSDFLLLPYQQISQSGVLLTALNARKRVIVSKVGGLPEPFQFGNIGYILDDLSPETLSSTLRKAADNSEALPPKAVWEQIRDYYDWVTIGKATEEVYIDQFTSQ